MMNWHLFSMRCPNCKQDNSPMTIRFNSTGEVYADFNCECGTEGFIIESFERIVAVCHKLDTDCILLQTDRKVAH